MNHTVRGTLPLLVGLLVLPGCGATTEEDAASPSSEEELVGFAAADVVGTIAYGETRQVPASPGRRYRALRFTAKAGDAVDVWVRSTGDAHAFLLAPGGRKTVASNADADGTTKDAHLAVTLAASGEHTIAFRDDASSGAPFTVVLAKATGPVASAVTDPCVRHPWPMTYGCRDRQGRTTSKGPIAPSIAWQTQLPTPCSVTRLLVDAEGTVYTTQDACQDTFLHAKGAAFSAVKADGTIQWSTATSGRIRDLALGGDDALYGYVTSLRPLAAWSSVVVHAFVRFDPKTGASTTLFSEEIGTDAMPRTITPLADGRVQFSVPGDIPASAGETPSAKIYDPTTKALTDATTTVYTPWLRSALAGGGDLRSATDYDTTKSERLFWVERHDAAGALTWRADGVQLWAVAPGGTVYGILPQPLSGSSIYGRPVILSGSGTATTLPSPANARYSPYTLGVGADDALVVGMYDASASTKSSIVKYTKTGTRVFQAPVPLEGGNVVIDAEGNIYAGGAAFDTAGTKLAPKNGVYVPTLDLVAPGPNRTLYAAWSRPNGSGTLYALRDLP